MERLTLRFESRLFDWPPSEYAGVVITAMEESINEFLRGAETIDVGGGVVVHLDWLYKRFKASFDVKYIDWFSLKFIHADDDLRPHEAFSVIIRAGDKLQLKKNNDGDIVSIELMKAKAEA